MTRITVFLGVALFALVLAACAKQGLPEPDSRPAKLYAQYCAGSGCHDPIPPGRDTAAYWDNQWERMIEIMRERDFPLPSPQETQEMLDYLHAHAAR